MRKWVVAAVVCGMAGCAGVSVREFHKDIAYPPTHPSAVVVYPQKPAGKDYAEIGEITVTGAEDWRQVEKIFRQKAAQMGADAVYVFSKQEETRQYVDPDECAPREGFYYPYGHFGWHRFGPHHYYPRGYYYCYGYRSTLETATFITAVGIAVRQTP
ncbi:MAG: hypothetical protein ACM3L6_05025 [Deltaproteobacteria bacterium]